MTISFEKLKFTSVLPTSNVQKNRNQHSCARPSLSVAVRCSSVLVQNNESDNSPRSRKIPGPSKSLKENQTPNALLNQRNTVGIIGGVSVFSTLIFLEKLVWWSSRDGQECIPFVVCSDPALSTVLPLNISTHPCSFSPIVDNLRRKRNFLEQSGAGCVVMPCHLSHAWYDAISEDCSKPFFHTGDCVASELKQAELKPLEVGGEVKIGVLATNETLTAGFYQLKLQSQGFEVVLPDEATMNHILLPAIEAFSRRDVEGARNLLRVAIQVLLVKGVNIVVLASDEIQGLLPHGDPLLRKCINPMDALARSTLRWAKMHRERPVRL
ncbi:hypothetical protein Tsubulata_033929 [Turnera subulata]|uniref:Aspartate racemase n=1 Tax=Turnera subulata TaxID=218843 RepID=A0A9Q0G4D7_9ROSI|nr:hypothetical protein Tsubulata_033929 [Turnera subulata]